MGTSRLLRVFLAGWMLGASGCVTSQMWSQANETDVRFSRIRGDVSIDNTPELVIGYHHSKTEQPVLLIPLLASGQPAPPFNYTGHLTSAEAILNDISPAQRGQILSTGRPVNDLPTEISGNPIAAHLDSVDADCTVQTACDCHVVVAAYRMVDGHAVASQMDWDSTVSSKLTGRSQPGDYRIPPGAIVLLVPGQRDRVPKTRADDQLKAAIVTPAAVAVDALAVAALIVVYPVFVVFVTVTGAHGC